MPPRNKAEQPVKEIGLNTRRLSTVKSRDVVWLWRQRIPIGKMTILSGDPDKGKTFLALDIISRLTKHRKFPDDVYPMGDEKNTRDEALWVSAEDEDEDTVVPRLELLKSNTHKVHSLTTVWDGTSDQILDVERHLAFLEKWLNEHPKVSLVILDPLPAFLGKRVDSYKNHEVRVLLTPLSKLAARCKVAIVCINHLVKGDAANAIYRGMGSVAFVAAARSSWLVAEDPKCPRYRRYFAPIKNNLRNADIIGLAFYIGHEYGGIQWETCTEAPTADEVLKSYLKKPASPARDDIEDWLREFLKSGPQPSEDVWSAAESERFCEKTVKAAKKRLKVQSRRVGGATGYWEWSLPK